MNSFTHTLIVLAGIAALFQCPPAPAQTTLGIHLGSTHSNQSQDWRNVNPGAYLRFGEIGQDGAVIGAYANSERKTSVYAARVFETERGTFALTAGLATGYLHRISPLIAVSARMETPTLGTGSALRLHLAPKSPRYGATALHLSFETLIK